MNNRVICAGLTLPPREPLAEPEGWGMIVGVVESWTAPRAATAWPDGELVRPAANPVTLPIRSAATTAAAMAGRRRAPDSAVTLDRQRLGSSDFVIVRSRASPASIDAAPRSRAAARPCRKLVTSSRGSCESSIVTLQSGVQAAQRAPDVIAECRDRATERVRRFAQRVAVAVHEDHRGALLRRQSGERAGEGGFDVALRVVHELELDDPAVGDLAQLAARGASYGRLADAPEVTRWFVHDAHSVPVLPCPRQRVGRGVTPGVGSVGGDEGASEAGLDPTDELAEFVGVVDGLHHPRDLHPPESPGR